MRSRVITGTVHRLRFRGYGRECKHCHLTETTIGELSAGEREEREKECLRIQRENKLQRLKEQGIDTRLPWGRRPQIELDLYPEERKEGEK